MIPTLLADFSSGTLDTRTQDGIVSATGVGALRFRDGGALLEEAGANAAINPRAAIDTSGWINNQPATITRDTTVGREGGTSFRVVTSGGGGNQGITTIYNDGRMPASSGQTWTMSCWVRGDGVVNIIFSERDAGFGLVSDIYGGDVGGQGVATLTGEWQRLVMTKTVTSPDTAYLMMRAATYGSAQAVTFWMTEAQVEQKLHATSYIDGSLGPGYAWTGTAHDSASTRAAASILAPCELPGWVAVRYSEDFGQTWGTAFLAGTGTVDTYGQVSHDGDNLVLASDRATIYGQVMAGNGTLTLEQQATLIDADGDWTWDMFVPRFGGIYVSVPVEPIAVAVSAPVDPIAVGGTGG